MDHSHQRPDHEPPTVGPSDSRIPVKRSLAIGNEPPSKKIRPTVEVPAQYSDAVRKKLAATSRTGQACDRCKERKMKCDTNPVACQPCRQKNLRCFTTDRVTGQSRERGQTDRAESELQMLREQNAAYRRKYGPLEVEHYPPTSYSPPPDNAHERSQHHPLPLEGDKRDADALGGLPDARYIGWPAPSHTEALHTGPVNGTNVDILDGTIDIGDFPCEEMDEYPMNNLNIFNLSRTSVVNTLAGYQMIKDPRFPSKEQAIQDANTFLILLGQFVPIVHRPSFIQMIHRIYDQPNAVSQSERVQLAVVLAIVEQQMATRNHREATEKFEQSHHHIHYALTYYRELVRERTLPSMQALALILVHFRNLPKPGYTWSFGHNVLMKVMDAEYHRDPEKIRLPPAENNALAKEMRKRVFHSILGICVTTGCRVGRPAPWQFSHIDVPLPMAIMDSEVSEEGIKTPLSGSCDFWPCLQLAKFLPLLTEMYNHVTSVRRTEREYLKTVEILHTKVDAWRRDWDESIRHEEKNASLNVATLLVEGWAAEYILNLYHPALLPTRPNEIVDQHLDICHKHAQRLLKTFHILSSKYKGVDFTWHSTVAYALGFGVTLHVYRQKKARVTTSQFEQMKNELKGWMSLMAYADLVLRTRNHLQHIFDPRVRKLEAEYQELMQNAPPDHAQQQSTNTSTSASLSSVSFIKRDPSPRPSPSGAIPNGGEIRPTHNPQDLPAIRYPPPQAVPNTQHWGHPAQYTPHTSVGTPTYATYTTDAPPYAAVPTSLAPLLNDHSSGYMTYSPNSQIQQSEMMMFQPGHYTDGPTALMWPMIALPQQDQRHQRDHGGSVKFN